MVRTSPESCRQQPCTPSVLVYDGGTGELELSFYPLGITSLAAEAAMIGQPGAEAA